MNARDRLATAVIAGLVAVLPVAPVLAQDATPAPPERAGMVNAASAPDLFSAAYLFQVLGSLLLVFLCLLAVVYLMRRFNGVRAGQGAALRVLASASVGQREKVVLIEAGKEQLLIGVAQGSVRTLHVMAEPLSLERPDAAGQDFATILRSASSLGARS